METLLTLVLDFYSLLVFCHCCCFSCSSPRICHLLPWLLCPLLQHLLPLFFLLFVFFFLFVPFFLVFFVIFLFLIFFGLFGESRKYSCFRHCPYGLVISTFSRRWWTTLPPICHVNSLCNNTIGSYSFTCKPGYTWNGKTCTWLWQNYLLKGITMSLVFERTGKVIWWNVTVIHDIFIFIHNVYHYHHSSSSPSQFFLFFLLGVLQNLLILFLQMLTNAQNRRTTVACILSASTLRVLLGVHTTAVEKAVRVRNHRIMYSFIFLTFKVINTNQCNWGPPPPSNVERKWSYF